MKREKTMKNKILGMFPHLCIVISLMLLIFFVTDRFNSAMAFINHAMTKRLLVIELLFCGLCALLLGVGARVYKSKFGILMAILTALLAVIMAVLLLVDHLSPAMLLLTQALAKTVIALLSACSIPSCLLLIRFQRRSTVKKMTSEARSKR